MVAHARGAVGADAGVVVGHKLASQPGDPPLLYEVQLEDDGEDGAEIVEGPPEFLWPREPAAAPRARGGGAEALGLLREKVRLQGALDRAAYALEQRASAMGTPGGSAPPPPAGQRAPPPPPPGPVHL